MPIDHLWHFSECEQHLFHSISYSLQHKKRHLEEEAAASTMLRDSEGENSIAEADDEIPHAPARCAYHKVVQDSDSDDPYDSENSIDPHRIKKEEGDAPAFSGTWDDTDSRYSLEYFDESPPTPGLRPLQDDDVDWEILRVEAPGIDLLQHDNGHTLAVPSFSVPVPSSSTPNPPSMRTTDGTAQDSVAAFAAPAPDANSVDSSNAELPRRRTRTKRKMEFECICGKEVTASQRESTAVKCSRAGCETIWVRISSVEVGKF
jgi:hypothetical protein